MVVVLATASPARLALLRQVGLEFSAQPARIDEDMARQACRAEELGIKETATHLAALKAQRISTRAPEAYVVGFDQMMEQEGEWFDKVTNRDEARARLYAMRGKTHRLVSAAVVFQWGERLWHCVEDATLEVRLFSDAFLEDYLQSEGEALLGAVGCYHFEGRGLQLFSGYRGDYFTILGLPLLPLIDFLRVRGELTP